jgi:hypothetical protein
MGRATTEVRELPVLQDLQDLRKAELALGDEAPQRRDRWRLTALATLDRPIPGAHVTGAQHPPPCQ